MIKPYFLPLTCLALLFGCQIDETMVTINEVRPDGTVMTIQATREGLGSDEGPATRTVRDVNGDVLWVPGDAISLFYGSGTDGGSKFTSVLESGTSKVTNFTGTITAITGGADVSVDDTYFWGVYPYNDDVSCDGQSVTMTVPTAQTAVPGTFATGLFPSLGRSQGLIMGFYNVCGGWRFSVTKEGVRKVTLKSNGGELITGKVKVGMTTSGVPEIREIIDGSDEVVLECPAGEYFEVGKNYYMVLLPTVFTSGFTMTFETYTEEGVYNRTKSTTITRSSFAGITNIDNYLTTPYAQKTGNIPVEDANFKAYLVENFDGNGDGEISYAEAAEITRISVCTDDIESVQGIEFMPALQGLSCSSNKSASWSSVAGTTSYGRLSSLDVSNNPALTSLYCDRNHLTTLDVSSNPALTWLDCGANQLTALDVSSNAALDYLKCDFNQLTALDVSSNPALYFLNCSYNQLTSLDVSYNQELTDLNCNHNQLTTLDVSNNPALTDLRSYNNQLTSLDVSNNPALEILWCDDNHLTTLDVSDNPALIDLNCSSNQLTSLDVSNNLALKILSCINNQLSILDVSNNTALTNLSCGENQLTTLDVSINPELGRLACYRNQLTTLDISNNTSLAYLNCGMNQLTSLDVSSNAALDYLKCDFNQLTALDVSSNPALYFLNCSYNQLTSLDVSYNQELTDLNCNHNQLTTLDVSKNTALTNLDCSPMEVNGSNILGTLFISQGQEIPNVTTTRSAGCIPDETQIVVKQEGGTNEGTSDEEVTP